MSNLQNRNNNFRKLPVFIIVLGCLGLIFSAVSMIYSYKAADSLTELLKPLIINFIPFAISFVLIKIGIKGVAEGKK